MARSERVKYSSGMGKRVTFKPTTLYPSPAYPSGWVEWIESGLDVFAGEVWTFLKRKERQAI
jgi:hypothetical protein